ncbi:hypothetical protein KQI15_13550 [Intestinimonas butyriciproducens]|uniref:hypothetical protein n=1 Tax=Intestinimonas butyriciproducens TaxID=1297617 RepID=UPI001C0F4409|nr:hypothetical protein [Intestinimonas butyriciproducens]MBU5231035.1 hypothetical protein [Intestinimonas butyriciproducens]
MGDKNDEWTLPPKSQQVRLMYQEFGQRIFPGWVLFDGFGGKSAVKLRKNQNLNLSVSRIKSCQTLYENEILSAVF